MVQGSIRGFLAGPARKLGGAPFRRICSEEQAKRMNEAVLEMKKFDLEVLEKIRRGVSQP